MRGRKAEFERKLAQTGLWQLPNLLQALPDETAAHCGLVPYRAVGTESGLLLYFRPDRVLEADGTTLDCVCAAGPPGFESGQYEGLICV